MPIWHSLAAMPDIPDNPFCTFPLACIGRGCALFIKSWKSLLWTYTCGSWLLPWLSAWPYAQSHFSSCLFQKPLECRQSIKVFSFHIIIPFEHRIYVCLLKSTDFIPDLSFSSWEAEHNTQPMVQHKWECWIAILCSTGRDVEPSATVAGGDRQTACNELVPRMAQISTVLMRYHPWDTLPMTFMTNTGRWSTFILQ